MEKRKDLKNLRLNAVAKALESEERDTGETDIYCKLSVEQPDRMGDIIEISGIELDNYKKNPVVLFNHDHKTNPIARGLYLYKNEGTLYGTIRFHNKTPLSKECSELAKMGYLRGVSVGIRPLEIEDRKLSSEETDKYNQMFPPQLIKKSELLEFSLVTLPANQDALIMNSYDAEVREKILSKAVETGYIEKEGRVLSKANIESLKKLKEHLQEGVSRLDTVLSKASSEKIIDKTESEQQPNIDKSQSEPEEQPNTEKSQSREETILSEKEVEEILEKLAKSNI